MLLLRHVTLCTKILKQWFQFLEILFSYLIFLFIPIEDKMQKLTMVLLFGLLALASASSKFKRLTPVQPQPQCSLLEVEMCAGEIGGNRVRILADFSCLFRTPS